MQDESSLMATTTSSMLRDGSLYSMSACIKIITQLPYNHYDRDSFSWWSSSLHGQNVGMPTAINVCGRHAWAFVPGVGWGGGGGADLKVYGSKGQLLHAGRVLRLHQYRTAVQVGDHDPRRMFWQLPLKRHPT